MTSADEARAEIIRRLQEAGNAGMNDTDMRQVARAQMSEASEIDTPRQMRDRRCLICNAGSDISTFVNRMIVSGATYMSTYRALDAINEARLQADLPEIKYQTVIRHAKNHLPFKSAAVREIIERRARAAQLDFEEGATSIITVAAVAEAMMVKGMQYMQDAPVSHSDTLKAAQLYNEIMRDERGNTGIEAAFAELGYLIAAVKEVVPPEYYSRIVAKVEERRGNLVIEAAAVEEFDPGEQPDDEEGFDPGDDDSADEDF